MSTAARRKRSARFVDIAQAAGVSTATVNRVLNERGSVSAQTRSRVVTAARQLGVPRVLPDPRHGLTRFDVILANDDTPYFRRLRWALDRYAQMVDPRILIHRHAVDPADEARVAALIERPGHRRDGLMVALRDREGVRASLRSQVERGVPVTALMSGFTDLPALHYAGIDNRAAGRTAGHFIGRLARGPGTVLLLTHQLAYRAHAERIEGCREVLQAQFPQLRILDPVECLDEPQRVHRAVERTLARGAADGMRLVGLYLSGAGSVGAAQALERRVAPGDVAWVGHEISDEHRELMKRGLLDLVIDQDPDGQVASALHHLMHAAGYVESPPPREPNEFRLFCAENARPQPYLDAPLNRRVPAS